MWVPPEDVDPIVLHAPTRQSVAFFGAVCAGDGRWASQAAERFNAISFQTFLRHLLRRYRPRRQMVVVVDNARCHHARHLRPWLKEHRPQLRLDFLPPYSPDLNSAERVWKLTRRLCTHNQYFAELDQLLERVQDQFNSWTKNHNKVLHTLCAII